MKILKPLSVVMVFFLLLFRQVCFRGAYNGLQICLSTVIPAVFPFAAVCRFFAKCGVCNDFGAQIGKITKKLFFLDSSMAGALVMGIVCGYPFGAVIAGELYKKGAISKHNAEQLCAYINNPTPAFLIGFAGAHVFNSARLGALMLASTVFSTLIYAFINRKNVRDIQMPAKSEENTHVAVLFVSSVTEAVFSVLSVCGFTVFFSVITEVCKTFFLNTRILSVILMLAELLTGLFYVSALDINARLLFAVVCGAVSFSGLCALGQISAECAKYGISSKPTIKGKIIQGVINFSCAFVFYSFF